MKKLTPPEYRALFYRHVFEFIEKIVSMREIHGEHLIGVSGGVDSMVLLQVALKFHELGKIGKFRVAFVHHHTRQGQNLDGELVQKFCLENKIDFVELHAEGLLNASSNFEARARKVRRSLLLGELKPKELLWLGHHLDDSYEWSLIQKYRSGHPKTSLGIPVRNGRVLRPFMSVSKAQIRRFAKFEQTPFREDPTNQDTNFDRNYLRQELIPAISGKYPKYLKHYVSYSNFLANILHLGISKRINGNDIYLYDDGAIVLGNRFLPEELMDVLKQYSNKNRGEWHSQILKLLKAIDNGKKGPFQLSGGTEIYHTRNILMVYRQGLKNNDKSIADVLKWMNVAELENMSQFSLKELQLAWNHLVRSSDAIMNMPGLVLVCEPSSRLKTLNASSYDSLFPNVSQVCQEKNLKFISIQKLLLTWENKKEKLPERLSLVPLWNLSNLFAFQA